MTMRDAYFDQVTKMAKNDSSIMMVVADMSAPGLDWFRRHLPHRYLNVGIAEQAAVQIACGLALENMKPIFYAIQPFTSLRCYEQIKVLASLMNIPITIVGCGAGFGYTDSGPTHHALEDVAIMRILPHVKVWNPSSNSMAAYCARQTGKSLNYVRLDRDNLPEIHYNPLYPTGPVPDMDKIFANGFILHKEHDNRYIVTTGNMVHVALEVAEKADIGVLEVFELPIRGLGVADIIEDKKIYVLEENSDQGGLFSAIHEYSPNEPAEMYHFAVDLISGYEYVYGTRQEIQKHYGLDAERIIQWLS